MAGAKFARQIEKEDVMSVLLSDFIALAFGLVLLGLMALYAKALTRA
jgi:hypothetical protein